MEGGNASGEVGANASPNFLTKGAYVAIAPETCRVGPNKEGGTGHVLDFHGDGTFDVKYIICNRVEKNVRVGRVTSLNPLGLSARRTSPDSLQHPSLLSPQHRTTSRRAQSSSTPSSLSPTAFAGPHGVAKVIVGSCDWSIFDKDANPLLKCLKDGRKKNRGWMRKSEAVLRGIELVKKDGKPRIQLTDEENVVLVEIVREINRLKLLIRDWPRKCNPRADLMHAYGVGMTKLKSCVSVFHRNNLSTQRRTRSDIGLTIFNSEEKRQRVFTPLHYFKKAQRMRNRETIPGSDLTKAFAQLSPETLHQCELGAQSMRGIVVHIRDEIRQVMQHTNGVITWDRLAQFIAGGEDKVQPIGRTALRQHIMGTKDFRYMVTATLPQCNNERTKKWRYRWSIAFHIFWEGAKFLCTKVQVLYFHVDEKWFMALVCRRSNGE